MYFFKYKIEGWAEDVGEYTHEGLIYGKDLSDAVTRLESWYRGEINKMCIDFIGDEGEPYLINQQYEINEEEK